MNKTKHRAAVICVAISAFLAGCESKNPDTTTALLIAGGLMTGPGGTPTGNTYSIGDLASTAAQQGDSYSFDISVVGSLSETLSVRLSTDVVITEADTDLGSVIVRGVSPMAASVSLPAAQPTGSYYVGLLGRGNSQVAVSANKVNVMSKAPPCIYDSSPAGLLGASSTWQTGSYEIDGSGRWSLVTTINGLSPGDKVVWIGGNVDVHHTPWHVVKDTACPIDTSAPSAAGLTLHVEHDLFRRRSLVAGASVDSSFSVVLGCSTANCTSAPGGVQVKIEKFTCSAGEGAIQAAVLLGNPRTFSLYSDSGCKVGERPFDGGAAVPGYGHSGILCAPATTYYVGPSGGTGPCWTSQSLTMEAYKTYNVYLANWAGFSELPFQNFEKTP